MIRATPHDIALQEIARQLARPVAVLVDDDNRAEAGLQRLRVAPGFLAAPTPCGRFPRQVAGVAEEVQVVGVPHGQAEGLVLAAAEQDR